MKIHGVGDVLEDGSTVVAADSTLKRWDGDCVIATGVEYRTQMPGEDVVRKHEHWTPVDGPLAE